MLQHLLVVLEDERLDVVDANVVDARHVDGRLPVADAALARPVIGTWRDEPPILSGIETKAQDKKVQVGQK